MGFNSGFKGLIWKADIALCTDYNPQYNIPLHL